MPFELGEHSYKLGQLYWSIGMCVGRWGLARVKERAGVKSELSSFELVDF